MDGGEGCRVRFDCMVDLVRRHSWLAARIRDVEMPSDESNCDVRRVQPRAKLCKMRLQLCKGKDPAEHQVPLVTNLRVVHKVAGVRQEADRPVLRTIWAY